MLVQELMTRDVKSCREIQTLDVAARIMLDHDCGCVPVVDSQQRVLGILTDRDICVAALKRGLPLSAIHAYNAMSKSVQSCSPNDAIGIALERLQIHQLRRLPVLGSDGRLEGIVSLSDLVRAARAFKSNGLNSAMIEATLAAISRPRVKPSAK